MNHDTNERREVRGQPKQTLANNLNSPCRRTNHDYVSRNLFPIDRRPHLPISRLAFSDQSLDDWEQFVKPKSLAEECRYPDRLRMTPAGAHHDHWQGSKLRQGAHSPDQFQAVSDWHQEVGEHQVRVLLHQ